MSDSLSLSGINIDTRQNMGYYFDMPKISKNKLSGEIKKQSLKLFFKNIERVNSADDSKKFLNLFFTPFEKEVILRRLTAMILLGRGERYRKIQDKLEISRNTISKIKHIMLGDGYGRNLGKKIYSHDSSRIEKTKRKKLLPPYKGVESII